MRSRIPGWVDPLGLSSVPPRKVLVMNAGFNHHFSLECLEEYAMDMLSEEDCTFLEEHLLICSSCQDRLADADEYIRVAKAAALAAGTRKRLAKPMAAAVTLA